MKRAGWVAGLVLAFGAMAVSRGEDRLRSEFSGPPAGWGTRPLWFWNGPPSAEATAAIMEGCRGVGYAGFGILPTEKAKVEFMSPAYLDRYAEAVEKAAGLGMRMCLYDEFWFPSGSAGGQLGARYPEALSHRLDLGVTNVTGPGVIRMAITNLGLQAVVAMETGSRVRVDLAPFVKEGQLEWTVPAGAWQVMTFDCVRDGARGLVDYLDPQAVGRFIELTYERYYQRLGAHFGRTIDSAFYDEPTFHWVQGGRAWTPSFNERFRKRYGRDPALMYPALWFDIGPETAAARNALFGFRAELFSTGFVKTVAEWCRAHRIELTGHVDQEEVVNPVGLCGDLIKSFEHQPMPGIDQISKYGRAAKAYKVVSSAAANYDRQRVMTECYGAMEKMPVANLYKEAMDQFAKGINVMVPHAVWYEPRDIIFPPELSHRTEPYASALPEYNRYVARLQRVLQQGHPVVGIGVLYPIAGLQAAYRFGVGEPYQGGIVPPEADYMEVGECLSVELRQDYTFLHPEVLDERCRVESGHLRLEHPGWSQAYGVVIVPGGRAVSAANLKKLKVFWDRGGQVIFTTRLPAQSAEFGQDADVGELLRAMLGAVLVEKGLGTNAMAEASWWGGSPNEARGRAYFVSRPTSGVLRAVLREALPAPDVVWGPVAPLTGGNLSYLHKRIEGRDFYFFANSSDLAVETVVGLHVGLRPELWDPHTGSIGAAVTEPGSGEDGGVTRVRLKLPAVRSVFVVGRAAAVR